MAAGSTLAAFALIAPAAFADPVSAPLIRPLAGVGSDTTQALMNAISEDSITNKQIASYDAFGGTPTFNTRGFPSPRCQITRSAVNGSSAGVGALQDGLEHVTGSPFWDTVTSTSCLDFARSSSDSHTSFPSNPLGGPGQLSYIKYAKDGVTVSIRSDSTLPNGPYTAGDHGPFDLKDIYTCVTDPTGTDIRPILPQKGSGTRGFFLTSIGIPATDIPLFEENHPCINLGYPPDPTNKFRVGPEEHHGSQLNDARDIFPYSAAVYLSQINRVINDDHGIAILGEVNPIRSAIPNPAAPGGIGITLRSDSGLPNTFTLAPGSSETALADIYNCVTDPTGGVIRPVLPAPGAVRTAFLNQLGVTDPTIITNYQASRPCINLDFPANGRAGPVENKGSVIADPRSVEPYSIEAYTAQIDREVSDNHGQLILGLINQVPAQILNTGVTFGRDVFNVIPTNKESTAPWSTAFVGTGSLVCQDSATITRLGFGLEPSGQCGQIVSRTL